jgi:hypothetical protein
MKNIDNLTRDQIVEMSLDDLLGFWEEDVKIDYSATNLDQIILKIGILHAKYLKIMVTHKDLKRQTEAAKRRAVQIRTSYYNGTISKEEERKFGWEPFQRILNGKELQDHLDADKIVQAARDKVSLHEEMSEACKLIIKEIGNRSFQLRAAIDWQKFANGYTT